MITNLLLTNWKNHKILPIKFKEGVNFIIGPNGCGKTSILEAIIYSFIGSVRKKDKKTFRTIGTQDKTELFLNFRYENSEYQLKRSFNGTTTTKLSSPSLETDIGSNPKVIQEITRLFNTNPSFFENIMYSSEGEIYNFLQINPREFSNYLESLVGFKRTKDFKEMFEEFNRGYKKKIRDSKTKTKTIREIESDKPVEDINELKLKRKNLTRDFDLTRSEIRDHERKKDELQDKIKHTQESSYEYDSVVRKTEKIVQRNYKIFERLKIEDYSIQNLLSNKKKLEIEIRDTYKQFRNCKNELANAQDRHVKAEMKIREINRIKLIIDKLKINFSTKMKLDCPLCKKSFSKDEFLKLHKDHLQDIKELDQEERQLKIQIKDLREKRDSLKRTSESLSEIKTQLDRINTFDIGEIHRVERKIQDYKGRQLKINKEIQELKDKRVEIKKNIENLEIIITRIQTAEKVKKIGLADEDYESSIKGTLICDIVIDAIGQVLKSERNINLKHMTEELMNVWRKFFPYEERQIFFDENYLPYFRKGTEIIPYDNVSAGEKMILLILMKSVLLRDYSTIPFLILDEPLEHLNVENRMKILDYFMEIYKKGFIKQLIITTFEESLTRTYTDLPYVNIISLLSLQKYQTL